MPKTLDDYFKAAYPLRLIPDDDGGYVFEYPDLPGCVGQIDALAELPVHADEARRLWLETAYELGKPIPLPTSQPTYSGKFVVRIPKSLHRKLVETAEAEGVSLNAYVGTLLASGNTAHDLLAKADHRREREVQELQAAS